MLQPSARAERRSQRDWKAKGRQTASNAGNDVSFQTHILKDELINSKFILF